ncbi:MAG: lamin tail domain-containing protein [Cytophagales bacterium]
MKSIITLFKTSLFLVFSLLSFSTFAQQRYDVQTSGASAFIPSALTINVGDTVVWTNAGGSHNVNGTQGTYPLNPESFGGFAVSGSGSANWPFTHVFTIPGSYDYRCDPHVGNGMAGTIQVNAVSTACSDLYFSEYLEGASNNKALEIYNPTNAAVSLSDYSVLRDNNGGTTNTDTFQMDGSLAPGEVYVIANPSAAAEILNVADTTSSATFYNGDDALRLLNNNTGQIIDVIGVYGVDPGSNWPVIGINGVAGATNENDLVRDPSVNSGDTSWTNVVSNQWYVLPRENFNNLGIHNAQVCGSSVPAYLIEQVKGLDSNLTPDSLGVQAQLTGIIHNPDQGFNSSEFAMQDGTAGIWVTGADPIPGYPSGTAEGDIVRVFGTVAFSNGVTRFSADSINLIGNTNLYTAEKSDTLNEYTEGRYVKLDSVRIINNTQDSFDITGSGVNYTIVTLQSDTFTLRVDRDYELDFEGNPVPTGLFNVTGVGSQFDFSAPHDAGYQIFPSRYSDLEILTVSGDVISFSSAADNVDEDGGLYQIIVTTSDTLSSPATVDVVNTGNGTAALGTDFTFNDTTLNFSNTAIDSFILDVTVIDNALINPDKTVEFALRNITGALFGLDTLFTLTIVNDDVPTYDIGTIRGNDNLGGTTNVGVADSLGVVCRVYAIVTTPDIGGSNRSVTLQDATGGISIFQPGSANPPALNVGDSVEIVGQVGQFNGLSQFTNSTVINVISSGNALPAPLLVDSLGEFTESKLLQMNNMSFVDPAIWTASAGGSSFNIDITNGIDTFVLRVDSDLPVHSQTTPPAAPFDLICFGGQFDGSDPYTSGYQVFAIDSASFMPVTGPGLPTYTIADVTGINSSGVADSTGTECKLTGVAYGENFRAAAGGLEFTLIDPNNNDDGIAVFSSTGLGYTLTEGDELRVIGTIDQVFGLTRIVADSIVVISTGNTLKTPGIVTSLNEFSESNLVQLQNVEYLSEGNWTNSGASFDVRFFNASDTFTIRIDNDCDLYGSTEPNGLYNVTGIGGQLDLSTPFDSDYLLLPRRSSDLDLVSSITNQLNAENLRVYPNPSKGQITVTGISKAGSEVQVIDLLGKVIYSERSKDSVLNLNLESLKSGQYILRISNDTDLYRSIIVITD